MSATVIDIATAEAVEAEDTTVKSAGKRRDLKRIGKNLARQITKQGITEMTLEVIMERKLVDRVQAKSVAAHAAKTLEGRGLPVPTFS